MNFRRRYVGRFAAAGTRTQRWIVAESIRRSLTPASNHCDTVLLSYPRSGNHLLRYLLEAAFQRPTLGVFDHERHLIPRGIHDLPIFLNLDTLPIHDFRPVAVKRHLLRSGDRFAKMVFLVRDPVDAILSHWRHIADDLFAFKALREVRRFVANVKEYQALPQEEKFLVHYEELLVNPLEAAGLVSFLGGGEVEKLRFTDAWGGRDKAFGSLSRPSQLGAAPNSNRFPERSETVLAFLQHAGNRWLHPRPSSERNESIESNAVSLLTPGITFPA